MFILGKLTSKSDRQCYLHILLTLYVYVGRCILHKSALPFFNHLCCYFHNPFKQVFSFNISGLHLYNNMSFNHICCFMHFNVFEY